MAQRQLVTCKVHLASWHLHEASKFYSAIYRCDKYFLLTLTTSQIKPEGDTQGNSLIWSGFILSQIISNQIHAAVVALHFLKLIQIFQKTSRGFKRGWYLHRLQPHNALPVFTQRRSVNIEAQVQLTDHPRVLIHFHASRRMINWCPAIHIPALTDLRLGKTRRQLTPPPPRSKSTTAICAPGFWTTLKWIRCKAGC